MGVTPEQVLALVGKRDPARVRAFMVWYRVWYLRRFGQPHARINQREFWILDATLRAIDGSLADYAETKGKRAEDFVSALLASRAGTSLFPVTDFIRLWRPLWDRAWAKIRAEAEKGKGEARPVRDSAGVAKNLDADMTSPVPSSASVVTARSGREGAGSGVRLERGVRPPDGSSADGPKVRPAASESDTLPAAPANLRAGRSPGSEVYMARAVYELVKLHRPERKSDAEVLSWYRGHLDTLRKEGRLPA